MANYQHWLVETGHQPNYLPPPWTKPRARPNAKRRSRHREAGKWHWESEGWTEYEPHSYDPYYYEGREYGAYEEPYAEDDYGHSYRSPRRQDRHPSPPQWSGDQGHPSLRDRVDTSGFAQGGSSTRQEVGRMSPHRRTASSKASAALIRLLGPRPPRLVVLTAQGELHSLCSLCLDGLVPW